MDNNTGSQPTKLLLVPKSDARMPTVLLLRPPKYRGDIKYASEMDELVPAVLLGNVQQHVVTETSRLEIGKDRCLYPLADYNCCCCRQLVSSCPGSNSHAAHVCDHGEETVAMQKIVECTFPYDQPPPSSYLPRQDVRWDGYLVEADTEKRATTRPRFENWIFSSIVVYHILVCVPPGADARRVHCSSRGAKKHHRSGIPTDKSAKTLPSRASSRRQTYLLELLELPTSRCESPTTRCLFASRFRLGFRSAAHLSPPVRF